MACQNTSRRGVSTRVDLPGSNGCITPPASREMRPWKVPGRTAALRVNATSTADCCVCRSSFATPTFGELRARCRPRVSPPVRFAVVLGADEITDIGALQASAPPRMLFQVASQFNCLESPGPYVVRVAEYFNDPTQGPRTAVSGFPGALLRHYAAPGLDGTRFVQTGARHLNVVADAVPSSIAEVRSGYLPQRHRARRRGRSLAPSTRVSTTSVSASTTRFRSSWDTTGTAGQLTRGDRCPGLFGPSKSSFCQSLPSQKSLPVVQRISPTGLVAGAPSLHNLRGRAQVPTGDPRAPLARMGTSRVGLVSAIP
jgi:hypothetical protein